MQFTGSYTFLSTLHYIKSGISLKIGGKDYLFKNAQAAFEAHKVKDHKIIALFEKLDGKTAKNLGKVVEVRPDWNDIQEKVMYKVQKAKFEQSPKHYELLAGIPDTEIVFENYWNDTYWGVVNGTGQNKLGKILTKVKNELTGEGEAE